MDDLTICPNCGATMNVGQSCPECDHRDDCDVCPCKLCDGLRDEQKGIKIDG